MAASTVVIATAVGALLTARSAEGVKPAAAPGSETVGYAEAGATGDRTLTDDSHALTEVGVDGVNVERGGSRLSVASEDVLHLLERSHRLHLRASLLVGNFDGQLGDFSPVTADALLGSAKHIEQVASAIGAEVRRHSWDGVTLDLENLTDHYPGGLTALSRAVKQQIGAGRDLSVCVMASTSGYRALGYDLAGLGRAADHVVLMAYDQHGPGWSGPGPVGGTPWVTAALHDVLAAIPARRVQLGVAGYGYSWPSHRTGQQLSDAAARHLAAGHGQWDPTQQEWHARTTSGTVLWWSDARAIAARRELARRHGLGGIAIWSLGLSDPVPHR